MTTTTKTTTLGCVRRGTAKAVARVVIARASSTETSSGAELLKRADEYTSDLKEMGMTMPLIRRNVAGAKNDLKAGDGGDGAGERENQTPTSLASRM